MAERLDLDEVRARLEQARGREYWRGLEELAESEEFRELLHREFPPGAAEWLDPVSRRRFLQLMGASIALAGLSGCTRQPSEPIVPYVQQPEQIVPGKPLFFATAVTLRGYASGVLVESHEGRPTKIEGNPDHPASLGATDVYGQAWVLDLYDPDRAQALTRGGRIRPWASFRETVGASIESQRSNRGARLRILTETVTSPTLARQLREILAQMPEAKWVQYEPAGRDGVREGARLAFGEAVETHYRFDQARVVLSIDADFVAGMPGNLRYIRDWVSARRVDAEGKGEMNRLYAVESAPSPTGAVADHRIALKPSGVEAVARAVAAELGVGVRAGAGVAQHGPWIAAAAADLKKHAGASLVIAGEEQPAAVHALAHAMNHALGNVGKTVVHTEPVEAEPQNQLEGLKHLADEIDRGLVDVLLILGGNPVFTAPADLDLAKRLDKVALRTYWGAYQDETSALCHWHVPAAHPLETWSDARAHDGTVTILQPLIDPLYEGKSAHELLAALFGSEGEKTSHDLVRETYAQGKDKAELDRFWRRALHDGLVAGTALPAKSVTLRTDWTSLPAPSIADGGGGLEIAFRLDPTVFDGRWANNGWLQELPKPLTKLAWDNAAIVSPATAGRLGLESEMLVTLVLEGRSVEAPVWVQPGQAEDCVTVHLGYGRARAGRVGAGAGFDAYAIRSSTSPWAAAGLEVRKSRGRKPLVCTQLHHSMEGRHIVRAASLEEFRKEPEFARKLGEDPGREDTMYEPPVVYDGYAWGMAIDLSACVGCNACVIACQAENNIPVVGKDQVARQRAMHWIRLDRYYKGSIDAPETALQPVPCMHCENAPCEVVCPVGATNHSAEGLNDMIYNRCVGTRYCANNCPYKVRRFNFYLDSDWATESLKGVRNPNVTVRSRGVMEKCTYCVQRINAAKIEAEKQDRRVRDGEIRTACQQVCPADAIVFGDVNDAQSRVAKLRADPRNYGLLAELNTRPRTTYLAQVRNPNPDIAELEPARAEEREG
ncbi:MAG: TAT-variant-translocated molybdopterin oxidoreductase [Deltaproteobacteria bacterium]|nr:TAT-variant-translocated molybdopterin oxidoreductase [Deltaproteobacteria bacterium]